MDVTVERDRRRLRVAFNARGLSDENLRGWNRYTVNLLAELSRQGIELYLYTDKELHADHLARLTPESYRVVQAPPMRYVRWEQAWVPAQCARDRC